MQDVMVMRQEMIKPQWERLFRRLTVALIVVGCLLIGVVGFLVVREFGIGHGGMTYDEIERQIHEERIAVLKENIGLYQDQVARKDEEITRLKMKLEVLESQKPVPEKIQASVTRAMAVDAGVIEEGLAVLGEFGVTKIRVVR